MNGSERSISVRDEIQVHFLTRRMINMGWTVMAVGAVHQALVPFGDLVLGKWLFDV